MKILGSVCILFGLATFILGLESLSRDTFARKFQQEEFVFVFPPLFLNPFFNHPVPIFTLANPVY